MHHLSDEEKKEATIRGQALILALISSAFAGLAAGIASSNSWVGLLSSLSVMTFFLAMSAYQRTC